MLVDFLDQKRARAGRPDADRPQPRSPSGLCKGSRYARDRGRLRPGRQRTGRPPASARATRWPSWTRAPTPSGACPKDWERRDGGRIRVRSRRPDRAGIDEAGAVAAVTSGDNTNILTARIARETFEVPNVVARIYDPRRAVIYQRLGIPTVATVRWTVDQVVRRLLPRGGGAVVDRPDRGGQPGGVRLPEAFCGRGLVELADGDRYRPVMVTRGGQARVAGPLLVGQEGDMIHFAVRTDAMEDLATRLRAGADGRLGAAGGRGEGGGWRPGAALRGRGKARTESGGGGGGVGGGGGGSGVGGGGGGGGVGGGGVGGRDEGDGREAPAATPAPREARREGVDRRRRRGGPVHRPGPGGQWPQRADRGVRPGRGGPGGAGARGVPGGSPATRAR